MTEITLFLGHNINGGILTEREPLMLKKGEDTDTAEVNRNAAHQKHTKWSRTRGKIHIMNQFNCFKVLSAGNTYTKHLVYQVSSIENAGLLKKANVIFHDVSKNTHGPTR